MNKKFSTLVAGLLLAGGAFSSAYADKLSSAVEGKFYKLEEGAYIDRNGTAPTVWVLDNSHAWFIDFNETTGETTVSKTTDNYWRVVKLANGKYKFVDINNKEISLGGNTEFELNETDRHSTIPAGLTQLSQNGIWVGYKGTVDPYIFANQDEGYAAAWNAVPTNLQVAATIELTDKAVVKMTQNDKFYTVRMAAATGLFSFVDQAGNTLTTAEGVREFKVTTTPSGTLLQPVESDKYVKYNNDGTFSVETDLAKATLFGFSAPIDINLTADQLKWYEQTSFSVTIKGYDAEEEATVALADNVFTGSLVPEAVADGGKAFYLKKGDNYIVAKAELAEGLGNAAYQFTVIDKTELQKDKVRQTNKYWSVFRFTIKDNINPKAIETIDKIEVCDYDGNIKGKVGRLDFKDVAYLAVQPNTGAIVLKDVNIKMGGDQLVDWKTFLQKGKYAVIKCVTKDSEYKNYYLAKTEDNISWVKSVDNDLEIQFAVTKKTSNGVEAYWFTNREYPGMSTSWIPVNGLYSTAVANQYRYGGETYEITFVEGEATDGYKTLDPIALLNQKFYVGVYSPVWKGTAWLAENHKNEHKIGLDSDKDNANLWVIEPQIDARKYQSTISTDYVIPTDSVYVISTIGYYNAKDDNYDTTKDTLKIASYTLTNTTYGETIQNLQGSYYDCDDEGDDLRVALRKSGNYLNLVPVNYSYPYHSVSTAHNFEIHQSLSYKKLYAGDSADKGLLNNTNLYAQNENDLFVLEAKDAPAYMKLNQGDVIRIYREGNESEQLFENGEFASLGNAAQLKDMNPALYVDTAWMNRNEAVNRYDYMLAVNVDRIVKAYECNVPDHKDLYHYVDTTYGRFLVNLYDSTVVKEDINDIHYSKYEYLKMPKLGFKYGFHTADKFFVPNAKDTTIYTVGNANYNIAKFAFQMVDDKNFVIETSFNNNVDDPSKNTVGYLKWINGNLVVTPYWNNDGEVFSLTADDRTPTANEAVAAEVSVVAVKGAIIVKGAAGKVVTVANILGQTIANQVAASDNVTIAAPAGVAVVTVDGEATKVIVK